MSRSGHRRTTAYDIAYKLGIAQSTVSRALNGSKNVSPAMRQRVLLAAQELNYSINQAAARLRTKSTRTLALVVLHLRDREGLAVIRQVHQLVDLAEHGHDVGLRLAISHRQLLR